MPTSTASAPSTPTPRSRPLARLALASGEVFHGRAFGAIGRGAIARAEVVFNTAMSGYQESLTDPSYTGQILVQAFPLIGNTGANPQDAESSKVQVAGLVVRELARAHSNYRANESLHDYLARHAVLGIEGIDTRALTKILRGGGSLQGALTDRPIDGTGGISDAKLADLARTSPGMEGQNLVPLVGCASRQSWSQTLGPWAPATSTPLPKSAKDAWRVLALDCGAKANILRHLAQRGCELVVVPHDTSSTEIRRSFDAGEIDGLFVSNGPGDPAAVESTIQTLREIVGGRERIPTFGICLGHQLLALAIGAKTYKLKFGHRGINQPVQHLPTGRVEITSQNHGFAVEPKSLRAAGGEVTHVHLNDGTVAGFRLKDRPVFSVQYHPEASPGPHDAAYLFDEFVRAMSQARSARPR